MRHLRSLFVRANGMITAHPTGEQMHLDDIAEPVAFFRERLDPSVSLYDHIACDVTDNCNLRCPFCINDFADASSEKMRPDHFAKLVQVAPLARDESVFVSCLCEPFLHPRLLALLRMIPEALRIKFFLTTNLSVRRLDERFCAELASTALHHVNVSVDSLQKQIFESMRVNARHAVFMDNLDTLAAVFASAARAPQLRFITVAARSNVDDIPELVQVANERYKVQFYEVRYPFDEGTPAGAWRTLNLLSDRQWASLIDRLTDLPYWTHLSRGNSLLLCGFGTQKVAPEGWGPDARDPEPLPWHLPLQMSLEPLWRSVRRRALRFLGRRLPLAPEIDVTVATGSADGAVRLAPPRGVGAFALTVTNRRETGLLTVVPRAAAELGLVTTVCTTEPTTGQCLTAPGPRASMRIERNATQTLSVFLARRPSVAPAVVEGAAVEILVLSGSMLCGSARVAIRGPETGA